MDLFTRTPAPILRPDASVPWASGALFNPGATTVPRPDGGHDVILLARGVPAGHARVDVDHADPYEAEFGYDDYVSALGLARRQPDGTFRLADEPFLAPASETDRWGCEDARITRLGDRWWITYTALAEPAATATWGVGIALASTTDWQTVERHGRIGPAVRDKDAALFPKTVGGRIAMFHRVAPDVQLVFFEDEEQMLNPGHAFWDDHFASLDDHVVLRPERPWEFKKVGMGPPPIETPEGWLVVYHAADADHVYRAGLALLDLDDPCHVIARTRRPVLEPTLGWERHGDIPNVVFPQGAIVEPGADGAPQLSLYYGAADTAIGHASAPLADVLDHLREEGRTPSIVPAISFDFRGDRDRRVDLGTSPIPIERLHGGAPVLEPTANAWESGVVLNPAAVLVEDPDELDFLCHAWSLAESAAERLRAAGGACVMLYRAQGTAYPRQTAWGEHAASSLGLAVFTPDLELVWRRPEPVIAPEAPFHDLGVEDARCTKVGDTYYLHYTGYTSTPAGGDGAPASGHGAGRVQLCLATTQNFLAWELHGPIPGTVNAHGDKNGALFPEPTSGPDGTPTWWLWHRPMAGTHPMAMHLASAPSPDGPWHGQGRTLASRRFHGQALSWVGAAGPPVALGDGRFLALYHQGHLSFDERRLYNLSAALVRPGARPTVEARVEPILIPEGDAERRGDAALGVDNVVFSCANYVVGDDLVVPYAGADSRIFGARLPLVPLVAHLEAVARETQPVAS